MQHGRYRRCLMLRITIACRSYSGRQLSWLFLRLSGRSTLDNGHLQHNMMAGFTPRQHIQQSACRHNTGHRDHCIQRGQARTADLTIRGIIFSHQRNLLGYLHAALFQDVQKADCYQIIGTDDAVNFGVLLQQCSGQFFTGIHRCGYTSINKPGHASMVLMALSKLLRISIPLGRFSLMTSANLRRPRMTK